MSQKWKDFFKSIYGNLKNVIIVVCIVVIGILLILRSCQKTTSQDCPKIDSTQKVKIVEVIKWKDTTIYKPKPIYSEPVHDTSFIYQLDTMALRQIVKLFYERKYYHSVLKNDSTSYAELYYVLSENCMEVLKYYDSLKYKQQIITNNYKVVNPDRFKLYLSAEMQLKPFGTVINVDLAPGFVITFQKWAVNANYSLFSKSINLGLGYKLSFRKK